MRENTMRYLVASYVLAVASLALLVDSGNLPAVPQFLDRTPMGDKVAHFALAGGLALLTNLMLVQRHWRPFFSNLTTGTLAVAAIVTLEEASNYVTPHRTCSALDLVANYTGILVVGVMPLLAWRAWRHWRLRRLALATAPRS